MTYRILTNLPTVGADNDTWGDELNAALVELDTSAAKTDDVYDKATADERFVRTVNNQAPDANGNVAVAGGTGDVASVNGKTGSVVLTADDVGARPTSTQVPANQVSGLATVATSGVYTDLSGRPAAAIPATDKGAANGVATLDSGGKVTTTQLAVPSTVLTDATTVGKAVLTAPDGTTARTGIGALGTTDVPSFDMVNTPEVGATPVWDDVAGQFTYAVPSVPPVDNFALRGAVLNPGQAIPSDFPAGGIVFVRDSAPVLGAQVLGQNGSQSSPTSVSVTLTDGVATNEDIFVAFAASSPGSTLSTVTITDAASSSYSLRGQRLQGATVQTQLYHARPGSALASGSTVTVTLGASVGDLEVIVFKMTGLASFATSPDQSAVNSALNTTSLTVAAGGPTAVANEMAVLVAGFNQTSNAVVVPTNWTQLGTTQTAGGSSPRYCAVMVRQLTSISTPSPTVGITTSGVLVGVLATFKGA